MEDCLARAEHSSYLLPLTSYLPIPKSDLEDCLAGAEHSSYLLPLTSYLLRDAPCRAKRCSAPSDASCPAERSIVNYELSIVHCPLSIMNCPFLLRFSTQASLRAERSIVHCPFSILHYLLFLSHCKVTTRGRRNQAFGANDAARPAFSSSPPSHRPHCQPLSGKWAEQADGLTAYG